MIGELLHRPWPWYVTGPLLGLVAVGLLLLGNKPFGISSNLRHLCAACLPGDVAYFKYDWRQSGLWNLVFLAGVVVGGFVGGRSEEHTSELQSHSDLVCRLLLEKKKKNKKKINLAHIRMQYAVKD